MILLVVIELRFYSSNSQNLTCHPRELEALRDFINEVDSKPDGWDFNSTGDCCEWEGMHMLFFASLKRSGQEDTENHQAEDFEWFASCAYLPKLHRGQADQTRV
ncbi:unnamed protein product [Brassica oleracea var. botrytis]